MAQDNSEGPGLWCASRPAGARRRARYQTRLVRESARRARTAAYLSRYVPVRRDSLS